LPVIIPKQLIKVAATEANARKHVPINVAVLKVAANPVTVPRKTALVAVNKA